MAPAIHHKACLRSIVLLAAVAAIALGPSPAAAVRAAALITTPAAAPGAASSAPGPASAARQNRRLLQTPGPSDCSRSVLHCTTCRFSSVAGSGTKAVCSKCEQGYAVRARGSACWCAPGYYVAASGLCEPCGPDAYCPGSRSTAAAERILCGEHKRSTSSLARSNRECVAEPGYGWTATNAAEICTRGFYSPGMSTRRCTRCAASLTTKNEGAVSPADCEAPAGSYFHRGAAIACASGTYKDLVGNEACTQCPKGFTTPADVVGCTSGTECKFVMVGFAATASAELGVTEATPCPLNTYQSATTAYDAAAGVDCLACPANMQTLQEGSTSPDSCLAPPGYGWNETTGAAYACPVGSFNPGWNREGCTQCGLGSFTTDGPGSESPDDCKVPSGHFTTRSADGATLTAQACPLGTWGSDQPTYGLQDVECTKCPEHSTTKSVASTQMLQCLVEPGYGFYEGQVLECDFGTYNPGGNQKPCTSCGDGYNTSSNGTATEAIRGADGPEDCVISAGWTKDGAGGLKPCTQGFYKSALGGSACLQCPAGTTSTANMALTHRSDCDACRPGFGSPGIDPAAPACAICPSGTYSFGMKKGGGECVACTKTKGYSGAMVSPRGTNNPDTGCLPEFPGDSEDTDLTWNILAMSDAALSFTQDDTIAACQQTCHANPDCQYFVFYSYRPNGQKCAVRDRVKYSRVNLDDATKSYVLFEVWDQKYVAYEAHPSDSASLGRGTKAYATRAEALKACDASGSCAGLKFDHTASDRPWRTFSGSLWEAAVGKIRNTGESINVWVQEPAA